MSPSSLADAATTAVTFLGEELTMPIVAGVSLVAGGVMLLGLAAT